MPQYLSPGVYVEEIPSAVQAIVGVSTSTAGFIGKAPDVIVIPPGPLYRVTGEVITPIDKKCSVAAFPVREANFVVNESWTENATKKSEPRTDVQLKNDFAAGKAVLTFTDATDTHPNNAFSVDYDTFCIPVQAEAIGTGDGKTQDFRLASYPVRADSFAIRIDGKPETKVALHNDFRKRASSVHFETAPVASTRITGDYFAFPSNLVVHKEKVGIGNASTKVFPLGNYPVWQGDGLFAVFTGANDDYSKATLVDGNKVSVTVDDEKKVAAIVFGDPPALNDTIWANYIVQPTFRPLKKVEVNGQRKQQVKLCTSFSDYRKYFGDFSADRDHNILTHAVYGFFHNGGSRCYVGVMDVDTDLDPLLAQFAAIDEIAIVAYPSATDPAVRDMIVTHCKVATQDRFAIFDSPEGLASDDLTLLSPSNPDRVLPGNSDYAAFYFPWIQVFDPTEKTMHPKGDGLAYVPPSGHMAGIYARVDNTRGVHKAPANEIVLGALGLKYQVSKAQQDGLNPQGVNCIRELNGNIRVWGARTVGGDANGEWRYINVRRTMLYLRESIDEGVQWAVFEPNDQSLWAKITLNVSAFLTIQWRAGMLFGSTAQEAFYVKCDAETNPPELREIGQVVTEIGVAIVRPAEFVIFRISQWQPQKGS